MFHLKTLKNTYRIFGSLLSVIKLLLLTKIIAMTALGESIGVVFPMLSEIA